MPLRQVPTFTVPQLLSEAGEGELPAQLSADPIGYARRKFEENHKLKNAISSPAPQKTQTPSVGPLPPAPKLPPGLSLFEGAGPGGTASEGAANESRRNRLTGGSANRGEWPQQLTGSLIQRVGPGGTANGSHTVPSRNWLDKAFPPGKDAREGALMAPGYKPGNHQQTDNRSWLNKMLPSGEDAGNFIQRVGPGGLPPSLPKVSQSWLDDRKTEPSSGATLGSWPDWKKT